eukprot:gene15227-18020_t
MFRVIHSVPIGNVHKKQQLNQIQFNKHTQIKDSLRNWLFLVQAKNPLCVCADSNQLRKRFQKSSDTRSCTCAKGAPICPLSVLLLTVVAAISAVPTYNQANGHLYDIVDLTGLIPASATMAQALDAIKTLNTTYNGVTYTAYLATISSLDEHNFVQSLGDNSKDHWYISASRADNKNMWLYNSGPEVGHVIYQHNIGRTHTFSNWQFPAFGAAKVGEVTPNSGNGDHVYMLNGVWKNFKYQKEVDGLARFVVEYGGETSPFIRPVPSAGGSMIITNFVNNDQGQAWDMTKLSVKVTNAAGGFALPITENWTTYIDVTFPAGLLPTTGYNTIVFTDGTRTDSVPLYYEAPYASLVYAQPMTAGSTVTLSGDNFGTDASKLQVAFGQVFNPAAPVYNCKNVAILVDHTAITCVIDFAASSTSTMAPLYISVMGNKPMGSLPPFYHSESMRAIRPSWYMGSLAAVQSIMSVFSQIDYNTVYMGIVTAAQAPFISKVTPSESLTSYYEPMAGSPSAGFTISNIPYTSSPYEDGASAIPANPSATNCNSQFLCMFSSFWNSRNSSPSMVSYSPRSGYHIVNGPITGEFSGELAYYGVDPVQMPNNIEMDTAGGFALFTVGGSVGFRFTYRSYSVGSQVGTNITQNSKTTLMLLIPPGSGTQPLTVMIENIKLTGTIIYKAPSLESATSAPTSGGEIQVVGNNLGNNPADISVTIGSVPCTDIRIHTAYTTLTCTAPSGTGTGKTLTVTVSGQSATTTFNYQPPTISASEQQGSSIVFTGQNFGANTSLITATAGVTILSATHTEITATIPSVYLSQSIAVTVDGQASGPYDLLLTPDIASVTSVGPEGGDITISGFYLNTKRQSGVQTTITVTVDTTTCTFVSANGNSLVCTLGSGTFVNGALTVTIDNEFDTATIYSTTTPTNSPTTATTTTTTPTTTTTTTTTPTTTTTTTPVSTTTTTTSSTTTPTDSDSGSSKLVSSIIAPIIISCLALVL